MANVCLLPMSVCNTQAVGGKPHCVFGCPHFREIGAQFSGLFHDAVGCMGLFMWHKDPESVCRWCVPVGLWVLTGISGTWAWALLSFPLGLGLWNHGQIGKASWADLGNLHVSPWSAPSGGAKLCT